MFVMEVILLLQLLWRVVFYWLIGVLKTVLPTSILPQKSLRESIILITGSGSGIGRLMAIKFGKLGAKIVLWDVDEKKNLCTKRMLDDLGINSYPYTIDLTQSEEIYMRAEQVKQEVGDPDVLVNNAGIVSGKKLFDCPDELMLRTMAVNCSALFFTTKAFLPSMIRRRHGHIVTIASLAGVAGVGGLVDYCASKFGAIGFSEALRAELKGIPITVTTVCTYYINTGMFDGVKTYSPMMFPILEAEYVAERIVNAVLTNADELFLPWAANAVVALKGFLPAKAVYAIAEYFGFNRTMGTYKGRDA